MKKKNIFLTFFLLYTQVSYSANEGYVEASYTYWLAGEEGLNLGRSGDFLVGDDPLFNSVTEFLSQSFRYQSGFQVGAGWVRNQWTLGGNYTFVRNTSSQNSSAPATHPDLGAGVWLIAPWFLQLANDGGSLSGTQVGSTWKLGMDIGDLIVSYSSPQSA